MSERKNHSIDPAAEAPRKVRGVQLRYSNTTLIKILVLAVSLTIALGYLADRSRAQRSDKQSQGFDQQISQNSQEMMEQGRQIFRYDTFGDEIYWSDKLKLHQAIQGSKFGGVGPGVSPKTALAVGLKVDMDALPADIDQSDQARKGES